MQVWLNIESYVLSWCCQPAHDVCLEAPWDIMITNEKNQSNFAKMLNQMSEQIFFICKEEL
jgi:hypothetical protein